jgi:quinoprotein glucose dehydrogenase
MPRAQTLATLLIAGALSSLTAHAQQATGSGWPTYGGDAGGTRYSASTQITHDNLSHLHPVWTFHTHALDTPRAGLADASFETTPVLLGRTLYLTSPFDEVFALDAATGQQTWHFDPQVHTAQDGTIVTSRGVALWPATAATLDPNRPCATRVFLGTIDARLLALDAATGKPCTDFGNAGTVDLRASVHFAGVAGYGLTSAPTVIGDVVVVGSCVADNRQVDAESGLVRGFDARTGQLLWSWEPLPWAASQTPRTGAGNAWSTLSADPALGLVYVPTGSASPDFYGGLRPGDNRDADSVVALDARTGHKVWAFQTVHHNLWDYDVAAQPLLFTLRNTTPAVAIATKSGQVFVLDRRSGTPLYPITERPVPQSSIPGEQTSPTQPFSSLPPLAPLSPQLQESSAWHRSPADTRLCQNKLAALRYDGIYTPPGVDRSLLYPGSLGGVNWGSLALDPATGVLYANVNRVPFAIRLLDRRSPAVLWRYTVEPIVRDWPLWISLSALTLLLICLRRRRWNPGLRGLLLSLAVASLASLCLLPWPNQDAHFGTDASGQHTGGLTLGGPIVTASGLVFTAATRDAHLRAFDAATGSELWSAPLPAPAQATPMTYTLDGRQFLVIAAGGHTGLHEHRDDALIAFAIR